MNKKTQIAVTGANGFIGTHLLYSLKEKYQVTALCRTIPVRRIEGIKYQVFDLRDKTLPGSLLSAEIIVHLAHQFQRSAKETDFNLVFSEKLSALRDKRIIFMSSFAAAIPVTPSLYGISKSNQEILFKDHIILRPALVIGNGAIFGRIETQAKRLPVFPLLGKGDQAIQVIGIEDLITVIVAMVGSDQTGCFTIAHPTVINYKDFIQKIAKAKVRFVRMPFSFLWTLATIFPFFGISRDNLLGLRSGKFLDSSKEFDFFNSCWKSPEDLL
jgi:nucleoside-diphosphate-sugar epimerase